MKRLVAILLLFTLPAVAESRTWTDASGKHHSTAELVEFQGGVVYLRHDDGRITTVSLTKLSKADQEFIRSTAPAVKVIEGKAIGIVDGDTFTMIDGNSPIRIRLEGIDAPESHQAYGHKSREALAGKIFQKVVRVEWRELDKYHRTLGHVFVDDRWINKDMVQEGWAWHYREYSKSAVLADAESDARTAKAGLWADPNPTPPWEFRHPPIPTPVAKATVVPQRVADPPTDRTPPPAEEITVFVTETGEKYHRDGCQYLRKSRIEMPLSEAAKSHSPCSVCHPPTPKDQASTASVAVPSKLGSVAIVDRNPHGETVTGQTATGIPTYTGPRGGHYHYSPSGKKVYERRKK